MNRPAFDFTILVLEGMLPTGIAATRDILATAEVLSARAGAPSPRWRLCSLRGGPVALQGGMTVATRQWLTRDAADKSVWVIPGLATTTPQAIAERFKEADINQVIRRLRTHAERGGRIATSCSAAFLLEAAGLLKNKRVTTTWWLAPHLQALSPTSRVDSKQVICDDGNITTAGSAFAQAELMMFLLKRCCGKKLGDLTASMLLIRDLGSQTGFILPSLLADADGLISRISERIESTLPDNLPVSELARELRVTTRTLSRHIRQLTGRSTLALIQHIKIRRARQLLEATRMTIEQVAARVGYSDSTALRRLIKRELGVTPAVIR